MDIKTDPLSPNGGPLESGRRGSIWKDDGDNIEMLT